MKIPKKLKVGGYTYEVVYPYKFKEDLSYVGLCESAHGKIKLADEIYGVKRNEHKIHETLIHELTHAIDAAYCANCIPHSIVTSFSLGVYQVLYDNKLFLKERSKKLPKKVKIGGFMHEVLYPYEYEDVEGVYSSYRCEEQKITIGDQSNGSSFSIDNVKNNLMYAILIGICELYNIKDMEGLEKFELFPVVISQLANGYQQTIVDNDLERLVRNE